MKLHLLQMSSTPDVATNLAAVEALLRQAQQGAGDLVVLPECFAVFAGDGRHQLRHAETAGEGPIQAFLAACARRWRIYLVAGTLPLRCGDKSSATSLIFAPSGQQIGRYDKIHLFDVEVADGTGSYRESDTTVAGDRLTLFEMADLRVGVMVCYDLRFPELARLYASAGAQLLIVPAAFTAVTGSAHWHVLLRAWAIENQLFVAACGQTGRHANGRETYGHSLVVDPWGEIIANGGDRVAALSCTLDPSRIAEVRRRMPLARHNRFCCHWQED